MKLIYLASPYSHRDPAVKEARFVHACKAAAWLLTNFPEDNVFAPIPHSHPMAVHGNLRGDWTFWKRIDVDWLHRCNEFMILTLPGWEESTGVTDETAIARTLPNMERFSYLIPSGEGYIVQDNKPVYESLLAA